jgi:SMODS-associated NUDIX domain
MNKLLSVLLAIQFPLWGALIAAWQRARSLRKSRGGPTYLWLLLHMRSRVRVSASSILAINDAAGDWLMFRSGAPEGQRSYWGPLGGVIKCYPSAREPFLKNNIEFHVSRSAADDMCRDLRLVMSMRRLRRWLDWFDAGTGRESAEIALLRELNEELRDAGVSTANLARNGYAPITLLGRCRPMIFRDTASRRLWHYRIFYTFAMEEPDCSVLIRDVVESRTTRLDFVSSASIRNGSHEGTAVGNHSDFLLGARSSRPAVPIYRPDALAIR